jgi:hypothetical protein
MAFWINASPEPKRQHRWYMEFGTPTSSADGLNQLIYALKKVSKPEATISKVTHKYLNHEFHYPGRLTWNEVTCDFASVTDPDAAKLLYKALQNSGYGPPNQTEPAAQRATISKAKAGTAIGSVINIIQIDSSGATIEKFALHNPFFTKVSFGGDLSYDNEEIVTLSCSIVYDFAQFVTDGVRTADDSKQARPPYNPV